MSAKRKTLDRSRSWQHDESHYDTSVAANDKGHLVVLFNLPDATDREIVLDVDLATKSVVNVPMGVGGSPSADDGRRGRALPPRLNIE